MYKKQKINKNRIQVNKSYEGETLEQKVRRITQNKEPIKDGAPLIYTEKSKGVQAAYDIRTDRFEIAVEAMDKITGSRRAKRDGIPDIGKEAKANMEKESSKAASTDGTQEG
ncbi:MAG: hypothetical protein [Microvirus sp.]|nr:MAG: hypothetical protein [Microvirus sp.]